MFCELFMLFILVSFILIYLVSIRKFKYWEKQKVPCPKPMPILGNYGRYILLQEYFGQVAQKICKQFPNTPYVGAYYGTEPTLLIQDPELIKLITTKDFYFFNSREIANYTHTEVLTTNLFFTYGDRWKILRQNLTPLFSSSKMRNMFHLIQKCTGLLDLMLNEEYKSSEIVEARSLMSRYTMDCVASCAFGVDTNTMGKNVEKNPFKIMGDLIFDSSYWRGIKGVARAIWPYIFYGLGFKNFPIEIEKFFHNLLVGVFENRQYKPSTRNDFVDLVLNMKNSKYITGDRLSNMKTGEKDKISLLVDDELLVGQCVVFFAAGFETSATTLSFTLYELAKCDAAQNLAIKEVDEYLIKHNGAIEYDCITELPYLEACIDEALRLYPVLGLLTREVVADYTLPDGVFLKKGTRIHLPVYHLHHNAEFFPDPEEFRPERFFGKEKQNIKPYTYLPFGEGPRICIGMRFAKMQMLPGLVTLLKKFRVELAPGMPKQVEFEPKSNPVTCSKSGIKLRLIPREECD